jgi:inosine-uridine nucleoside N-ribohydrolase
VEVLALGPLTNIALAVKLDKSFASKVKHLTIMGGCDKVGHTATQHACISASACGTNVCVCMLALNVAKA